jgi:hypothetical protein
MYNLWLFGFFEQIFKLNYNTHKLFVICWHFHSPNSTHTFFSLLHSIFSLCTLAPIDTDDNKQIIGFKQQPVPLPQQPMPLPQQPMPLLQQPVPLPQFDGKSLNVLL